MAYLTLNVFVLRWIETRLNFLGAAWTKEEKMKHLMTFHSSVIVGKWTFLNAFLESVEHLYVCQQRGKCLVPLRWIETRLNLLGVAWEKKLIMILLGGIF